MFEPNKPTDPLPQPVPKETSMPKLAVPITVRAAFLDPFGAALDRAQQVVATADRVVPFREDGVILKRQIPVGTDFEVALWVDKDEAVIYRGEVPVPERHQAALQDSLRQSRRSSTSLKIARDLTENVAPKLTFFADIWWAVRVARTGFAEYQVHIGEEGIGTQKWVTQSQLWVSLKE